MKLFFNAVDGEIFYAVYDADLFKFTHTTNIPLNEFVIDEVGAGNQAVCSDIVETIEAKDATGQAKYYIDTSVTPNDLIARDGWVMKQPIEVLPVWPR